MNVLEYANCMPHSQCCACSAGFASVAVDEQGKQGVVRSLKRASSGLRKVEVDFGGKKEWLDERYLTTA